MARHGRKTAPGWAGSRMFGVSVSSVGGTNVQAATVVGAEWRQKACHCPLSLLNNARRWQTVSVPYSRQRMPASFRRWPTTVLQADSTAPEPIDQPLATYVG